MRVVRKTGAEALVGPPAKGGKQPAVEYFGVEPGRLEHLAPLVSGRVARATHLRQKKKVEVLSERVQKFLPCKS